MKLLLDFLPVLLFFAVYKAYAALPPEAVALAGALLPVELHAGDARDAIYLATAAAILTSALQVGLALALGRRVASGRWIALGVILVFGGATLLLHDAAFIKWKPTVLDWAIGAAFLASHYLGRRTLAERLMGEALQVPAPVWRRVNLAWAGFFAFAGALNLYVAHNFSERAWVSFKLFGLMGLTIGFILAQSVYLARHMRHSPEEI